MNWLKEFRERHGLSQNDLALELGVSQSYISKIEKDQLNPSFTFLLDIRNKFNYNVNKLIDHINYGLDTTDIESWWKNDEYICV